MCGGPRIEGNLGGEAAIEALKEQKQHLGAARLASIATVLQGMFATAVGLIMLAVRPETTVARVIFFLLAAVPLALSFVSRWRASKARGRAQEASERALQAAAEEVAREGVTAKDVAKKLRIAPSHAEKLLAAGMASDRVRIDVHDESAEVVYRSDEREANGQRASGFGAEPHRDERETHVQRSSGFGAEPQREEESADGDDEAARADEHRR